MENPLKIPILIISNLGQDSDMEKGKDLELSVIW